MQDINNVGAIVTIKLTKVNEDGTSTTEEHTHNLNKEEAEELWQSQMQA